MSEQARALANGRWRGLLPALGVSPVYLTGKHTGCPICKTGTDRFRFDNRGGDGSWFCNSCGSGDGYQLVEAVAKIPFKEVVRRVRALVGATERDAPKKVASQKDQKAWLNSSWQAAGPVSLEEPVGRYLHARTGLDVFPSCLRAHHGLPAEKGGELWPTLLARVTGPDGMPATLHRTFLDKDLPQKAPIPTPRKLMPGQIPKGAAIRLGKPADGILGIAEGIETALSATALTGVPCWAAIDAGRMVDFVPPPGVTTVLIFGDNDVSGVGQMAAYTLARRLHNEGIQWSVRFPDVLGEDWNDVLKRKGAP